MNKSNLGKNLGLAIGTGLLTLGLTCGPLQSNALAGQTKEKVTNICDLEPEAGLELYAELDNEYNKGDSIFVLYKVCSGDGGGYIMVPEKYSKKKHGKFDLYGYNSEQFLGNEPHPIKGKSGAVFLANEGTKVPATGEFYVVIVDNYAKSEKDLKKLSASLQSRVINDN